MPSWNNGPSKQAIVDFVTRVMREGGPDFVPLAERIAVFDNDSTLWAKQLVYFQFPPGRPILTFGNSDRDHQMMLQWQRPAAARFMGLVAGVRGLLSA